MTDLIEYKKFFGSLHFNSDDEIFYGKIEGINDLISFEGKTVKDIKRNFKDAVNDYIYICKENDKPLYKSYKGSFNIRVPAELHKKAVQQALLLDISLNKYIQKVLEKDIKSSYYQ